MRLRGSPHTEANWNGTPTFSLVSSDPTAYD